MRTGEATGTRMIELKDGVEVEVSIESEWDYVDEDNGMEGWTLDWCAFDIENCSQEGELTEGQYKELKEKVRNEVDSLDIRG